ncbi:four-carbon acid sugar kinase family protein [Paenibacillus solisilvae]|uniref:Four-carbon acid sugar kinase family protein n=1 Tax=Paenibacillus solisilvae TaxID=2486751 RepID=A0ABW0W671_9BACL
MADDLTGASDSGVQFARKGLETQVIFDLEHFSADTQEMDAVVLDTDSRSVSQEVAFKRVTEAAIQVKQSGFKHVYKKMDSTLRGNLGIEIDAVMDKIQVDFAVVAPAFPKIGRTTLNGIHFLHGVPIDQTEIARDPKCPVKESNLVKLFTSQSKRKVGLIPLKTLHAGNKQVLSHIKALLQEHIEIIVFDAVTEEDVQQIAEMMAASDYRILWAGSAGLADYLPMALSFPVRSSTPLTLTVSNKPVLLVAGSISKVTRSQVFTYNMNPLVTAVELNTVKIITSDEGSLQEIKRCRTELLTAISAGSDVSLYASSSPEHVESSKAAGAERGFNHTEVSNRIANILGEIASGIMKEVELQGVILTGGDTAKAVCKHLGVSGIELIKEIEPGIPLGKLVGNKPLWVVTKAGAFGNENSLLNSKKVLKGVQSNE